MAEQKPIISIDHVSMRFNLSKEKHESLKEYFVALLHGGVRFDEFFAHGRAAVRRHDGHSGQPLH